MTYDELKEQVRRLSQSLDALSGVRDPSVLEKRIELRQLLNQLDIAAVPSVPISASDFAIEPLIAAVDRDMRDEASRVRLVSQIGSVIRLAKQLLL
jgi:hypothetical protein